MWWCVTLSLVVWASVVALSDAQHGVPLPGLPQHTGPPPRGTQPQTTQLTPGVALAPQPTPGGGVPLPHLAGGRPQTHFGPVLHGDTDTVVVPLGGVPVPGLGAGVPAYETVGVDGVPVQQPAGGRGSIRPVRDPGLDESVQRVVRLAAVQDHLQLKTEADTAVKIREIISAHKQVVSGQLVYLTLRVGETKCPIGTPDLHVCAFDPTEDTHICEIVVWERPWLNISKVIDEKSRCAETEDDNDFNSWGSFSHLTSSHSEVPVQVLPDGINEQQLGIEAFNYIDRGSESKFRGEMITFDLGNILFDQVTNTTKVQVNVEYGFKLCLRSVDEKTDPRVCPRDGQRDHYICSVVVVHNPNQISRLEVVPILEDDDDIHCEKKRSVDEELVVPVQAPCLGCPQPAPLNDPTILEIADFALKEYDRTADDEDLHLVLRLIKAQTQVVAGLKYYLTVELAETDCKKTLTGVDVNRTFCRLDSNEETKICDLHVVDQPWIPARDLVAAQCYDKDDYPASSQDEFIVPIALGTGLGSIPHGSTPASASRPSLLGGHRPLEIDAQTLEVVKMVVDEYNRREDDSEYYKLVKVLEASSQVVSGKKYTLVVELAETNCHKFDPALGNGEHCLFHPTEDHEVCKAEVHEQAWLQTSDYRKIVSFTCDDLDDYLEQRLMPTLDSFDFTDHPFLDAAQDKNAGFQTIPKNDSTVQEVAAFVTEQYNLRGDEDDLYALTRVISSYQQAVSGGVNYHLEIELAETRCKKYLPVADPGRCPLDHGEEREVCQAEIHIPQGPGGNRQLVKLYCDEISDYFTRKIQGTLKPSSAFTQPPTGSGAHGGAWTNADVSDKSLVKLGHLIADEYDSRSDEDNLFIFHKLLQARKQIAGGIKYHLVAELVHTVCPKYKRRIDKTRCQPDIGEEHVVCEANVLTQPWLKRQVVTDLRCAEKNDFVQADDSVEILYPNVHPTAHARPVFQSQFLIRGSEESDESNERFYDPSRRTASSSRESNEDDSMEINQRFYHPSGRTNFRRHDTEEDDSDELPSFRDKRSLVGGFSAVNLPDSKISELASFAVKSMDAVSEDPNSRIVETVIRAEKQTVAGVNWKLQILVSWTTCLKEDQVEDSSTCTKDLSKPSSKCDVTIYEKPWENYIKVTEMACSPVDNKQQNHRHSHSDGDGSIRKRRKALGAYSPVDLSDQGVNEVAKFAVRSVDAVTNDPYVRTVENVRSAQVQIVAGKNWKLEIELSWTLCRKEEGVQDLSNCEKDPSKPNSICDVIVYEVPWQNTREVTKMECKTLEEKQRHRRNEDSVKLTNLQTSGVVGGYTTVQLPNEDVSKVALFAVQTVDVGTNDPNVRVVEKINSASKQIVAGINWKLEIELSWTLCRKEEGVQDLSNCEKDPSKPNSICDVIVYEVPWQNTREVTKMECKTVEEKHRHRRNEDSVKLANLQTSGVVGGYTTVQLPNEDVSKVAMFAVQTVDAGTNDPNVRVVEKINSASKQTVAGINWKLEIELSWTLCRKEEGVQDLSNCEKDPSKPNSICNVIVYEVPWQNTREVTKMECKTVEDKHRHRRNEDSVQLANLQPSGVVGGYTTVQLPNEDVSKVAMFAVQTVDAGTNDPNVRVVEKINSASKQTVAGINWKLEIELSWTLCRKEEGVQDLSKCEKDPSKPNSICDVIVYEVPWQNTREVTKMECKTVEDKQRHRRNEDSGQLANLQPSGVVGGYTTVQLPNEDVSKVAMFAVQTVDVGTNDPNVRVVEKINSASKQIVAGINWKLEIELSWTLCRKEEGVQDLSKCEKDPSKPNSICDVIVYEVPWQNTRKVTKMECKTVEEKQRHRRNEDSGKLANLQTSRVVGGYTTVQLPNEDVSKVAMFAVQTVDAGTNDPNVRVVEKINSASKQIVAGINWKLEIELSWTLCRKEEGVQDLSKCEKDPSKPNSICDVIVYEVPWQNTRKVTKMECKTVEEKHRHRRNEDSGQLANLQPSGVVGGYTTVQLPNEDVSKVAMFAVQTVDAGTNDPNVRVVEKINSASKQVVAGINWKLEIELSWTLCRKEEGVQDLSNCEKDPSKPNSICDVIVYEVPWQNTREVTKMECKTVENKHRHRRNEDSGQLANLQPSAVVGGYTTVQLPNEDVSKVALFAVQTVDAGTNDPNVRVVEKINSASKQIVAGINWKLEIELSWTLCRKEEGVQDLSKCEKDPSKPNSICDVIVYEVPWQNTRKVTKMECRTANCEL
ncbi:uncharacterized protein [Procambarus clarkii]|uniref:uncharacterized protein isoform X4 n=1 Tax=Procambarus clarkii TaxID=6728 RepID=UPI0037437265